jgi:hypothetical protein
MVEIASSTIWFFTLAALCYLFKPSEEGMTLAEVNEFLDETLTEVGPVRDLVPDDELAVKEFEMQHIKREV